MVSPQRIPQNSNLFSQIANVAVFPLKWGGKNIKAALESGIQTARCLSKKFTGGRTCFTGPLSQKDRDLAKEIGNPHRCEELERKAEKFKASKNRFLQIVGESLEKEVHRCSAAATSGKLSQKESALLKQKRIAGEIKKLFGPSFRLKKINLDILRGLLGNPIFETLHPLNKNFSQNE